MGDENLIHLKSALPYVMQAGTEGNMDGWSIAAGLFKELGDTNQELEMLRKAAQGGHAIAAFNLGIYFHGLAQYNEALTWLQKAEDLGLDSETSEKTCLARGNIFSDQNEPQKALEHYNKVKNANAYNSAAKMHLLLGNIEKGKNLFMKAAEEGNKMAMENLAHFYLTYEEYKSAFFWFDRAQSLGSKKATEGLKLALRALREEEESFKKNQKEEENMLDQEIETWDEQMRNQQTSEQNLMHTPPHPLKAQVDPNKNETPPLLARKIGGNTPPPSKQRVNSLNAKGLRGKMKELGVAQKKLEETRKMPPKELDKKAKSIAKALLEKEDDHVDVSQIEFLADDPYFQGKILFSPTKSGCKLIAFPHLQGSPLKAGTHKKHGLEKFTGSLHPAFRNDFRNILDAFGLQKGNF